MGSKKEKKITWYTWEHDKFENSIIGYIEAPLPPPAYRVSQGFRYANTPQKTHVIS